MNDIVLYNYFRSSTSIRVRVALALKGVAYIYEPLNLREGAHNKSDYRAINPQSAVPALVIDGHILTQSIAIIEFLNERYPNKPLLPSDHFDRARIRAIAAMMASDIHPLTNLRVLQYLDSKVHIDLDGRTTWCRNWIQSTLGVLEDCLHNDARTGRFCHGNTPGLADICLYAQVISNSRYGVGTTEYPTIERIYRECEALPEFQCSSPQIQPDAV